MIVLLQDGQQIKPSLHNQLQEQVHLKCDNLYEHYVQMHQGTKTFTKPLENIKLHGHVVVLSLVELDVVNCWNLY